MYRVEADQEQRMQETRLENQKTSDVKRKQENGMFGQYIWDVCGFP